MLKCVMSGEAHLCSLAPGLHSYEQASQRWRHYADLTDQGFEPQTSCSNSNSCLFHLTTKLTQTKRMVEKLVTAIKWYTLKHASVNKKLFNKINAWSLYLSIISYECRIFFFLISTYRHVIHTVEMARTTQTLFANCAVFANPVCKTHHGAKF